MKVLVALKRVADPDNANKVKVSPAGDAIETSGLEWKTNPFDEYALEAALRLTENGKAPKKREGEVVVVTLGPKECETMLRAALATGADRAIRIEANDNELDGSLIAIALKTIVDAEKPDLILLGKQAVDGDSNQVGQRLAELLDYPMATFAATINITSLTDITDVRVQLEARAAERAATLADADDRREAGDLIAKLDAAESGQRRLIELDAEVHRFIYRCSRNPYLEQDLDRYLNMSLRIWHLTWDRLPPLEDRMREHRELLETIRSGDAERARSIARAHVLAFADEMRSAL